jgi:hypothetical protein
MLVKFNVSGNIHAHDMGNLYVLKHKLAMNSMSSWNIDIKTFQTKDYCMLEETHYWTTLT